jgi:hypothetical protein
MTMPDAEFRETGLFRGVPFDAYSAWPGLRKSRLWTLNAKTPAHYKYELDHPEEVETPALVVGKAAHLAIADMDLFRTAYTEAPPPPSGDKWDRRTKEHKAAWAAFESEVGSRVILTTEQFEFCMRVRKAVAENETARTILAKSEFETSMQWNDERTGMLLKGRMDALIRKAGAIADFKTTECAAADPFGRAAYRYGYHFQMALYYDGLKQVLGREMDLPVLIAIEKEPPHLVACYQLSLTDLDLGRVQYRLALEKVQAATKSGKWAGYDEGLCELVLPPWAGQEICYDTPTDVAEEDKEVLGL